MTTSPCTSTSTSMALAVSNESNPPLTAINQVEKRNPQLSYSQCNLICEIMNKQVYRVDSIIKTGINVNFLDSEGNTPLNYAIYNKDLPILRSLLNAKADLNLGLPLIAAINMGSIEVAERLLHASEIADETEVTDVTEAGAPPTSNVQGLLSERDMYGQTPLIWAVAKKHIPLVDLLLQEKAQVNDQDHNGNTALILAAKLQSPLNIVSLLLEARADLQPCNMRGRSAYFYATTHEDRHMCQAILTAEARLSKTRSIRFNPVLDIREIGEIKDRNIKHITHKLYRAAKVSEKVVYNPFQKDVEDAIRKASVLKDKKNIHIKIKVYLLKIIQEKYSTLQVNLAEDDIRDIIEQKKQLQERTIEFYDYKYHDYDPSCLDVAIQTYRMNQFARSLVKPNEESVKPTYQSVYPVMRYRMPGFGTHAEYLQLRKAANELPDHEIIAAAHEALAIGLIDP